MIDFSITDQFGNFGLPGGRPATKRDGEGSSLRLRRMFMYRVRRPLQSLRVHRRDLKRKFTGKSR